MGGYGWVRLHALLNDLPAALLVAAVLFDLLGAVLKRESLKAAGFWTLAGGVAGGLLAVGSGLLAENVAPHGDASHAFVETHETFAFVVLVLFGLLFAWRVVRRIIGKQEQTVFTTAGVIGVGLLVFTGKLGGSLVFDHGVGIDSHVLQQAIEERRGGHQHEEGDEHPAAPAPATPVTPAPESLRADTTHAHP